MTHFFISYAKKDTRELALALNDALNALPGVTSWLDTSLRAGKSWETQIQAEIRRCDFMIVFYSPDINRHLQGGEESYILTEIAYAKYTVRKSIIPVMAQKADPPLSLTTAQYIDYIGRGMTLDDLVTAVYAEAGITRPAPHETKEQDVASAPQQQAFNEDGHPSLNDIRENLSKEPQQAKSRSRLPRRLLLLAAAIVVLTPIISLVVNTVSIIPPVPTATLGIKTTPNQVAADLSNIQNFTDTTTPIFTLTPALTYTSIPPTASTRLEPTPFRGESKQIVFTSTDRNSRGIYTIDTNGSNLHNLVSSSDPIDNIFPVWSPNGTQIAFASNRDRLNREIYMMDADGSNPRRLTYNGAEDSRPTWSPDGTQIAFQSTRYGGSDIYVMDADGSNPRRLTNSSGNGSSPAWSPDGTQIAFMSDRDGNAEIYVMEVDGSNPRRLTNNPTNETSPTWSPDGTQIAFMSNKDGNAEIYVMEANGSDIRRLTNNSADDWSPAWSPDGTEIAFTSSRNGNYQIYLMDADGSNPRHLTNGSDDESPTWHP